PATTGTHTLSLHDALPIFSATRQAQPCCCGNHCEGGGNRRARGGAGKTDGLLRRTIHHADDDLMAILFAFERNVVSIGKLQPQEDRKSTRLNSSHVKISYA